MKDNRRLFGEARLLLVLARVAIVVIPFGQLAAWAARTQWPAPPLSEAAAAEITRQVSIALFDAALKIPWHSSCLVQALAGYVLLRRRGVPAHITLGVRKEHGQMAAHAWLRVGEVVVTGEAGLTSYSEIFSMGAKD